MIQIKSKKDCCGCGACVQKCPQQCISVITDKEGFEYPQVNKAKCINCDICVKVCPIINHSAIHMPLNVYAAKNKQEIVRQRSSSGGMFSYFAQQIIRRGGVVFGARFDSSWQVVMDYTDKEDDLDLFRRSKYVQAKIGDSFVKTLAFLKEGRDVLYSGTPCQIYALKLFLKKDYDNLLTIDFVCHGIPSPKAWEIYLSYIVKSVSPKEAGLSHNPVINSVNFRDKSENKWELFALSLGVVVDNNENYKYSSVFSQNIYMRLFLSDIILRPSCYLCPFSCGNHNSDITVADFWSIDSFLPYFNDHKGVSMLLIHTEKGNSYFPNSETSYVELPKNSAVNAKCGSNIVSYMHPRRKFFFNSMSNTNDFELLANQTLHYKINFCQKAYLSLIYKIYSFLGR